jgi:hypothetical protein
VGERTGAVGGEGAREAPGTKPKRPAPEQGAGEGQGRGSAVTEKVPVPSGSSNVAVQVTVASLGPALPPPLTLV